MLKRNMQAIIMVCLLFSNVCTSQELEIEVTDNVQILLFDKLGRKTGIDPSTKQCLKEIPNSDCYVSGVGYIGDEDVEPDYGYVVTVDGPNASGPFSLTLFGVYGGKYSLRIDRVIENRFVLNSEAYLIRGGQQEFSLEFNASNEGTLIKNVRSSTLKEDLQATYVAGDLADEHFYNELVRDIGRFQDDLRTKDKLKAAKELEKFQDKISKEHDKGIRQSPKRYVRPAAWKVLYDDAESLLQGLVRESPEPTGILPK